MNPAQTTKTLAQKIAKQMQDESLEILKDAKEQITGDENPKQQGGQFPEQEDVLHEQKKAQDNIKSSRLLEAFQRELEDVRKQNLLNDLQNKIAEGKTVPLEDYPELSLEHKQVLNAQMKAIEERTENQKAQQGKGGLIEIVSKKGRKLMNFGKKTAMKREQTHVEKPIPPSG